MADDDIIELTDIVKEGHAPAQAAPAAAVPISDPAAASPVPDFGADLDELLQNYDKPSAKGAPEGAVSASAASLDAAAHTVDPNEELELPPLSDLDALLEELGVQDNSPAAKMPPAASVVDDLDNAPDAAPAATAPAPEAAPDPAPAEALGDEGIDLNELDALLDSVLASAPKTAPAAAPASRAAAQPAAKAHSGGDEAEALRVEVASLRAELADLRGNMDKYAAAAAARVIREEIAAIASKLE